MDTNPARCLAPSDVGADALVSFGQTRTGWLMSTIIKFEFS
jgi:hypothetical protein